jgi:2-polyprenyl-3-methyl-5-hydroxy-6-metoxy-1,4-benzoquinol methylase
METTNLLSSDKLCPICNHFLTLSPVDDEYILCLGCGVLRTKYNYDGSQYSTNYALNYLEYAKSPCNTSLNLFRLGLISRWLKSEARVLDIGCCVGEFLRFAERYYTCAGFEPNLIAATEATKRISSEVTTHLNGHKPFNCVTMFDVIEHIQEPLELLKHINTMLLPGGIVALTTPNLSSLSMCRRITNESIRVWKHYKPREHLYLYTKNSLKILMHKADFSTIHWGTEESDIRPGNPNGDILTCVARKR